ncbi:MAG TPA: SRPBCC family protein [Acidimicrobiales bacterium]|nr:SRPBCC family protein [Acidimicrobiales bacterium]
MQGWVLTVERTVPAPPEAVFDLLADPARHHEIDGSGMLQGAPPEVPVRLAPGAVFGMRMKMGVRYSTVNRVVEFEENRRIAWRTGPEGALGHVLAGRVWRYELAPVEGGTLVRESWDITTDHQRLLLRLGDLWSGKTRRDMERTLVRLEGALASQPGSAPPA